MYVNCSDYPVHLSLCLMEGDEYLGPKAYKKKKTRHPQLEHLNFSHSTVFESLIHSRRFTGAAVGNKTSLTPRRKAGIRLVSTHLGVMVAGEGHMRR